MRIGLSALLLVVAAFSAMGQRPATQTGDDDVVKISTNLVQFDLTVTDKKGKMITDLGRDEIEIYENGERQVITNFRFVPGAAAEGQKLKTQDQNAPPIPQNTLRPEQIRRTIALVVDDLSLSFDSAYQTRRALKKFVDDQVQPGDLVAIIRTGAGIGALQQFTSDRRLLYASIEKIKWNPQGNAGISAFAPIEAEPDTSLQDGVDDEADAADDQTAGPGQSLDSFRTALFATGTLGALKYIVTGMNELPGRKSVILFSDGFKISGGDDATDRRVLDFLLALVEAANRASVVFYTIDARGLVTIALTAADNVADPSADAINSALADRRDQLSDNQEGLSYLASETGGLAIKNTNDLSGGVARILADQSYYLIGYEPDADTFDPEKRKFNKLNIKVTRKDAKARYRSGFFNVADREADVSAAQPLASIESALVSPFAVTGIDVRLNALFGSDNKNGAFVRSLLHINAADLKFTDDKDGNKRAVFDVVGMSFGDNGQLVDQLAKTYTLVLKPDAHRRIVNEGFIYYFLFPVKRSGAYQYRVALRDTQSGKLGSASQFIEVPELKKHRLTTSSIVIENLSAEQWNGLMSQAAGVAASNPMADTALRRVKRNTILRYGYEIYNARLGTDKRPRLKTRIRVFRDGTLILEGRENELDLTSQTDLAHLKVVGNLAIGEKMAPGDYVLQVIVTDELARSGRNTTNQIVQFEVLAQ